MQSEVQFDFGDEQRPEYRRSGSKLSRLVVKWSGGLVKDEMQANYVLLIFVCLFTSLAIILLLNIFGKPSATLLLEEKRYIEKGGSPESYDKQILQ